MGILITDHSVRETIKVVDRVYIISEGKVLASGKPQEVVEIKEVREVYLGSNFMLSS